MSFTFGKILPLTIRKYLDMKSNIDVFINIKKATILVAHNCHSEYKNLIEKYKSHCKVKRSNCKKLGYIKDHINLNAFKKSLNLW